MVRLFVKDYPALDTVALLALRQRGLLGAEELIGAVEQRCNDINPTINAVVHQNFDLAYRQARGYDQQPLAELGMLAGLPLLVKDLSPWKGQPYPSGSLIHQRRIASSTTDLLESYRQLGACYIGRSNSSEFGLSFNSDSLCYPPGRNPHDIDRSSGGSSGGAAAAVAAGIVPFAHASDGGGSLRVPAACCRLPVFKPGNASWKGFGWSRFTSEHVISRSLRDSWLFFRLCHNETPALLQELDYFTRLPEPPPSCTIAYSDEPLCGADNFPPAAIAALNALLDKLANHGHRLVRLRPPVCHADELIEHFGYSVVDNIAAQMELPQRLPSFTSLQPRSWLHFIIGSVAESSPHHRLYLQRQSELLRHWFNDYQLFVCPLLTQEAPKLGELDGPDFWQPYYEMLMAQQPQPLRQQRVLPTAIQHLCNFSPNTIPFNIGGQAAIVLPGRTATAAVQLVSNSDQLLFAIANSLSPGMLAADSLAFN